MRSLPAADSSQYVEIIGLSDAVPDGAETLGVVKVGDSGFSVNCNYTTVIEKAREEVRKAGGNAMKLLEHKLPSALGSTCHRITAQILYLPDIGALREIAASKIAIDSALYDEGCAVVHFYRPSGAGALVGYDIHVEDEIVTRMTNNSRESVKILAMGPTTFWARTETRVEVTLDVLPGYHYYVRCAVSMGVMVGHPVLEAIPAEVGEQEIAKIRVRE